MSQNDPEIVAVESAILIIAAKEMRSDAKDILPSPDSGRAFSFLSVVGTLFLTRGRWKRRTSSGLFCQEMRVLFTLMSLRRDPHSSRTRDSRMTKRVHRNQDLKTHIPQKNE